MGTDKKEKYKIDMCNGPVLRKMLRFTIPLICSGLLQIRALVILRL